jgi:hypothetical protein
MRRIALMVVGVFVVILLALFLVRLTQPESGDAAKVETALKGSASTLLAGTGEPAALAAARCTYDGDDVYRCTPEGVAEKAALTLVLAADGTVTERLAGAPDVAALRSGDGLAKALAADARARGLGNPEYGCATSIRMSPDGTAEAGNAVGSLCVAKTAGAAANGAGTVPGTTTGAAAAGARYVELAPDGTLTRDYVIASK